MMLYEKFTKKDYMMKSSDFKEDDLRDYCICGDEDIYSLINHAIEEFNKDKEEEWLETGNVRVQISKEEDEVVIYVFNKLKVFRERKKDDN